MLLEKHHAIRMNIETLKTRLKDYGLKRRNADFVGKLLDRKLEFFWMAPIVWEGTDMFGTLFRWKALTFLVM